MIIGGQQLTNSSRENTAQRVYNFTLLYTLGSFILIILSVVIPGFFLYPKSDIVNNTNLILVSILISHIVLGVVFYLLSLLKKITTKMMSFIFISFYLIFIVVIVFVADRGLIENGPQISLPLLIPVVVTGIFSILFWKFAVGFHKDKYAKEMSVRNVLSPSLIINSIADGVTVLDNKGNIIEFNQPAEIITEWKSENCHDLHYSSVFKLTRNDQVDNNEFLELDVIKQASISAKTMRYGSLILKTLSTNNKEIELIVSPIIASPPEVKTQTIVGTLMVFRDVSEERANERRRAEFISTASHEMRTPVAAIEGYLALALNSKVTSIDAKARNYLEKAHENTQHLGQLFQDLLTSAKAEDGRLANHPELVEIGQLLKQTIEELKHTAENKNLEVVYRFNDQPTESTVNKAVNPLYYAFVDPNRIKEVISNLFDNAVKYTSAGKITIGISGDINTIKFYIADTGQGIPPDNITHLFQKFYRVDNSDTRTIGGTGLGLFISKEIIDLYHGKLWAESKLKAGSIFYVSLPRHDTQSAIMQINLRNLP